MLDASLLVSSHAFEFVHHVLVPLIAGADGVGDFTREDLSGLGIGGRQGPSYSRQGGQQQQSYACRLNRLIRFHELHPFQRRAVGPSSPPVVAVRSALVTLRLAVRGGASRHVIVNSL